MANAPRVLLPQATTLFGERAARLRQLAPGHTMEAFLCLMANLADAQQLVLPLRNAATTAGTALAHSRDFGMPPLAALGHVRGTAWLSDLKDMCVRLADGAQAQALRQAVAVLDAPSLEALADRVLSSQTLDSDAAATPLVGAALQLYFTRLAANLDVAAVQHFDVPGLCPVCATRPMASIVRMGAGRDHLRYLACALCGTEWNLPRIQCSACQSEKSVGYLSRGGEGPSPTAAHRAEVCDECHGYLKIFNQEQDPFIEPLADDLASLALDIAVGEKGYARAGPNLLWHFGGG
jgi:FdhE protein